jgi:hypothetical protein
MLGNHVARRDRLGSQGRRVGEEEGMPETEPSDRRSTSVGFWVGWLTSAAAAVALVVAVTTVPRSGPYCRAGCLSYPYTDAGAFRFEVTAIMFSWLALIIAPGLLARAGKVKPARLVPALPGSEPLHPREDS